MLACLALALTIVAVQAQPAGQPPGKPEILRPGSGEYQHLWLTFDGGAGNAFIGLRDGKSTVAWFVGGDVPGGAKKTGAYRVLIDSHDLFVKGDALQGKIVLRQVSIWAPMQLLAEVTLTIDAKKSKDGFAGAWMSAIADGKKTNGTLIGRVTDEKSIRASESFAKGVDWPSDHGPHLSNRAADASTPLIDDLSKARPVWRAEMPTLSGWGSGVDGRYSWRAAYGSVCGGSGTPVVADGRVYLFHYVPSGEPDAKLLEKVLADFEKNAKRKPTAVEREALVDFCRPYSDTIVTCIDAQTGAVLELFGGSHFEPISLCSFSLSTH